MFQPKTTKYRKQFKGRNRGQESSGTEIVFGKYGLKATTNGFISSRQLEAGRRVLSRCIKRTGKIWIRVFPDKPITKKPAEVRQGKGKGDVDHWVCVIKPGKVLFELDGISQDIAKNACMSASRKMSVGSIFIERDGGRL